HLCCLVRPILLIPLQEVLEVPPLSHGHDTFNHSNNGVGPTLLRTICLKSRICSTINTGSENTKSEIFFSLVEVSFRRSVKMKTITNIKVYNHTNASDAF